MRKIMYDRALCILHKHVKPSLHTRHKKEVFDSHSKENHFVFWKMLNSLISVLFARKLKNILLSYSILTAFALQNCAAVLLTSID